MRCRGRCVSAYAAPVGVGGVFVYGFLEVAMEGGLEVGILC